MKTLFLILVTLPTVSNAADLLVAAAADLAPLQTPLQTGFQRQTHQAVRIVLGASGNFARQIENGAPYDVFLSADERYVRELVQGGFLDATTVVTYALGRLGLWSADNSVRSLDDLLKPSVRHVAIANPSYAPYGVAARDLLENRGLWKKIEPKIVYGENVREALQYAESRNAEAVITAWSLLRERNAILLPGEWHKPIRQAGGVVKTSRQSEAAKKFLEFLTGPDSRKLLQNAGFVPVNERWR